ncbi:TPA: AAA family ATPase [Elizabethkingia anophelis]|nr:AAA family ATPase [Elizabethkingia anophelis]
MKIKSLYIPDYYLLQDFNVEFSEDKNLAVIIGDNGSGKSSLLEVVAYIFGHLHKYFVLGDKTAEFIDGYEIEFNSIVNEVKYSVYLKSVYVRQKTNTFKPIIKINNEEVTISEIEKKYGGFEKFLPSRIGVYYAGEAQYLKKLSEHFENKYIKELIRKDNSYSLEPFNLPQERPFYYIKDNYLGFILLALIVNKGKSENIDKLLNHLLGTIDYDQLQILIKLKKPYWATSEKESLWGIESKFVNQFVEKLNDTAIHVKADDLAITYTFNGVLDIKTLFKESEKSDYAFMVLDTLYYNDILESVNIDLKDENEKIINSERLSEGQRQFLVTSGLAVLWEDIENKLFLYDEPDVFLHPKWQREYIPFLAPYFEKSFALLTTHNPILIGNLNSKIGQLISINNGKVCDFDLKWYGRDVNDITKDIMGGYTRPKWATDEINRVDELLDTDFEKGLVEFNQLKSKLSSDDTEIIRLQTKVDFLND